VTITRSEVIKRATTVWPLGTVAYSQSTDHPPMGWRSDCSGYVSMCLDLPKPGLSTVTLVTEGYISEITRDELQPGDLVGRCGEGTAADLGHVVLFEQWETGHDTYWAYELYGGSQLGPEHSLIRYPYHGLPGYLPYRYQGIAGGAPPLPGGHWTTVAAWPGQLSTISGIAAHWGIPDWHTVWDDPRNAGLRAHRVTPERVQPGDAVWVPAP
jgi:hypothetical protein